MKKLLIFLLAFAACKKEDMTKSEPKLDIHINFIEYPSHNPVSNFKVSIAFSKGAGYLYREDLALTTNNTGDLQFSQKASGCILKYETPEYFEYAYFIPGYNPNVLGGYTMLPYAIFATPTQIKKENDVAYYEITMYRKKPATLSIKQITPSTEFGVTDGHDKQMLFYNKAFDTNDENEEAVTSFKGLQPLTITYNHLIDTSFSFFLFDDLYNSVTWATSEMFYENFQYTWGQSPRFNTSAMGDRITIEF